MVVFTRIATLVLAALSAAACSSTVATITSYDVQFTTGVPSEFSYAAAGGDMPVVVIGNPFGLPQADVDAKLIAAMQGRNVGARVRFVPAAGESRYGGYRVVMLLDAGGGARADTACGLRPAESDSVGAVHATPAPATRPVPTARPVPASTGRTTLLAAFCGNADARSWAYSTTGPVTSPDDPLFRQLVSRTTFAMLPPRDDESNNQDYD